MDPSSACTIYDPGLSDILVDFHYDYSHIAVPLVPNGTGRCVLTMTAKNSGGVFSGFSVSPNRGFSGDYFAWFDLWRNYVGPLGTGGSASTQLSMFGIGSAGNVPVWPGSAGKESVMFAATRDGDSTADYRAYSSAASTSDLSTSGVCQAPAGAINGNDTY